MSTKPSFIQLGQPLFSSCVTSCLAFVSPRPAILPFWLIAKNLKFQVPSQPIVAMLTRVMRIFFSGNSRCFVGKKQFGERYPKAFSSSKWPRDSDRHIAISFEPTTPEHEKSWGRGLCFYGYPTKDSDSKIHPVASTQPAD